MTTTTTAQVLAPESVLKVREVAHRLDCDRDTVYRLVREGEIRAIRVGRLIRVPESALAEFISGGE